MKAHVALCIFLVGCVADPPSDDLSIAESAIKTPGDCEDWQCGGNSPIIDAVDFHYLWEAFNVENDKGYKITRVLKWGGEYRIDVVDGEVLIRYKTNDAIAARGYAAAGTKIEITNSKTGKQYELYISTVDKHEFWAKPVTNFSAPPMTWTYGLYWKFPPNPNTPPSTAGGSAYPVCGVNVAQDGMADFTAIFMDDEVLDKDKKRVYAQQPGRFEIGCAGTAPAKLHLLGGSKAAAKYLLWTSTIAQRTATLKMITADYCGMGDAFTVTGQKVGFREGSNNLWFNTTPSGNYVRTLEARWTENGATCLNMPRVDYRPSQLADDTFPDGVESMLGIEDGWCTARNPRPPPCTGTYTDAQGALAVSVNYRPMYVPIPL